MTYLEKEKILFETLAKSDYDVFDGDRKQAFDFVESRLLAFVNYANSVLRMEVLLPEYRFRYEGQDYRDHVQDLDSARKTAHDSACVAAVSLNRLCAMCGLKEFADIDTDDRHEVARFIGGFVSEVYAEGTDFSLDDIVRQDLGRREFSPLTLEEQVRALEDEFEISL